MARRIWSGEGLEEEEELEEEVLEEECHLRYRAYDQRHRPSIRAPPLFNISHTCVHAYIYKYIGVCVCMYITLTYVRSILFNINYIHTRRILQKQRTHRWQEWEEIYQQGLLCFKTGN